MPGSRTDTHRTKALQAAGAGLPRTVGVRPRSVQRVGRSLPARYPPHGAWPSQMRADAAAAFLDYETTGELLKAIERSEAPPPTARAWRHGRWVPLWAQEALKAHVANRHDIASDGSPAQEKIGDLV